VSATATWQALAPLLLASGWAILVLLAEMFSASRRYLGIAWLTVLGLAAVAAAALGNGHELVFQRVLALDGYTAVFTVMLCVLAIAAVFMAVDYLPTTNIVGGEYFPLVMFAVVGAIFMAAAVDLIVAFLALETMSMAVYVLAGIRKRDPRSNEAALKYFLLGAFSSGFMLYGIALLYGEAGSTVLSAIAKAAADEPSRTLLLGAAMVLVGFGFKVAAVPFHLWTPDVYEGAPTSVTAFMATVVKVGAFAGLMRVLLFAFAPLAPSLYAVLWVAAALTMTVGNLVALKQTSLKRMLAYSSIAHTGYMLVGLTAGTVEGGIAAIYYLGVYGAMNLGAFGVMMLLADRNDGAENVRDVAGLGQTSPMLALAMTLCMLSLTGIPPLGGFIGKLSLFAAALERGNVVLVVIGVLNSVVSAAYYMGVVRAMYFDSGGKRPATDRPYLAIATGAAVVATVVLGLAPGALFGGATTALERVLLGP
jgi:NADH-quinone oxidoreductase subunit N